MSDERSAKWDEEEQRRLKEDMEADSDLMPCPFCGGKAFRKFTGNDRTKSRKVTIICSGCSCTLVVGAIRFDHDWCDKTVTEKWNQRVLSPTSLTEGRTDG